MTKKVLAGILLLALLLFLRRRALASGISVPLSKSYLGVDASPGVRNNNPLNIRVSSSPWKGKVPHTQNTDKAFEQFTSWVYGVRAGIKNLKTHYERGKKTVRDIIFVWSPPGDPGNPPGSTVAYMNHVSRELGVSPDSPLLWEKSVVRRLVQSMARMETGVDLVTDSDFETAWSIL